LGKKTAPYVDLAPLIRELVTVYGSHRLMWASDCPFQVQDGHRYADSVDLIRQRLDFLTDEDRAWMLSKTAAQVYFNSVG
jgi:predicted TIM-barrel fold metal-dependent hydrolase